MPFGENTRDLGSFGEETDKITTLHQKSGRIVYTERGDGVAIIKQRRQDIHRDGVRDPAIASGRGRLKEDLESSTWRRRHNFKATPSRRVNSSPEASGSKPRNNTKNNRILPAKSDKKKKVEAHPRNNKSKLTQENCVDSSISFKRINSNSKYVCKTCHKCLISANYDKCVVKYLMSVNAPHVKNVLSKVKQVWKATGKLFANVGYQWKPTQRKFTLGE
ncbi:hypothetical protein Tco_1276369 [Tanacetum coccineum]